MSLINIRDCSNVLLMFILVISEVLIKEDKLFIFDWQML